MNTPLTTHISPTTRQTLASNVHLQRRVPHLFNIRRHPRRSRRATMAATVTAVQPELGRTYADEIRHAILHGRTEDLMQLILSLNSDSWDGLFVGIQSAFKELTGLDLASYGDPSHDFPVKLHSEATSYLDAIPLQWIDPSTHPGIGKFVGDLKAVYPLVRVVLLTPLANKPSYKHYEDQLDTLILCIVNALGEASNASFSTDAPVGSPSFPNPPAEEWNLEELSDSGSREVGDDSRMMQVPVPGIARSQHCAGRR
ncbi:hypothetical protein C8Q74DRAFT_289399 [Fomes fomentarius]|nr:hypothetical protein C8Q74DRAFT_289399 [Fomes fomentarius]